MLLGNKFRKEKKMKNPRNEFFQLLKIALLPKKDNKYFPT